MPLIPIWRSGRRIFEESKKFSVKLFFTSMGKKNQITSEEDLRGISNG